MRFIYIFFLFIPQIISASPAVTNKSPSEILLLEDGWEYRWGDSPFDKNGVPVWTYDNGSSVEWTVFSLKEDPEKPPTNNYFWERVKLPDIYWKDACLFLFSADQIYEVYLDGKKIHGFGDFDTKPVQSFIGYGEHFIHLPDGYQGKYVYFRFYSEFQRIGIYHGVYAGPEGQYFRFLIRNRLDSLFLGFISILAGAAALIIFFIGIRIGDRINYLIFSGCELALGIFLVCQSPFKIILYPNYLFWQYLDLSATMLVPAAAGLFIRQIIELRFKKVLAAISLGHFAFLVIGLFLDVIGVFHLMNMLRFFEILILVSLTVIITVTAISAIRGNIQSRVFSLGFIALAVFAGFDLLVELQVIPRFITLFSWGAFLFSASLAVILFRNYSSIKNQLVTSEKELEIARSVQEAILTSPLLYHKIDKLSIEVCYLPMNKAVSGDYYNISRLRDGIASIMIADASGHGTQAALSTMQLDVLNKESLDVLFPHERLEYINGSFSERIGSRNFFTSFLINIYPRSINYSSAGHPNQYLIKKNRELVELNAGGKPLGVVTGISFKEHKHSFLKNDTLVLFTDGLFEEFNPEGKVLGEDGLKEMFEKLIRHKVFELTADKIAAKVLEEIERFNDGVPFADDITLIVVKHLE
ncbi:MAG: hypothetical protein A2Y33_10660 [Spirochaetes bacterium GWF1_51_8]|nr:MAG: hypothetical protein A2Y33_10660 [Spirochaetes bacterium GWF1_51_8]